MPLPIDTVLTDLRAHLAARSRLVLQAPPGAGKTTRVPLALLGEPWLADRKILLLEPRRLAARAAAARLAEQLGEVVGTSVGYQIRFEHQRSPQTRIEVITEGILTRRLQADPTLAGIGLVIFDEFHERSLQTDLGLALALDSQAALRPDLRLLLMSATLDTAGAARVLGGAPVVSSAGRSHPVVTHYLDHDPLRYDTGLVVTAIQRALHERHGDLLVFLPGGPEIRRLATTLTVPDQTLVLPLYGNLAQAAQQQALQPDPSGRRKVVLATNIAETSLTIEGITTVIDSGWTRRPRFHPGTGLTRLVTERISQNSAAQRAGRAGRLGPGTCYRLWSEPTQARLQPHQTPEILAADLAPLLLELVLWGATPDQLIWSDPPPKATLTQARELLLRLGALDGQGRITPIGRRLAELPLHPRLAHMVLSGVDRGLAELACALAAMLAERDILRASHCGSDLDLRLQALHAYGTGGRQSAQAHGADPAACARVERAVNQLHRLVSKPRAQPSVPADNAPGLLLARAYPDRIGRRRGDSPDRYQLANGRGVRLAPDDPLYGCDWLVAAHLSDGDNEDLIRLSVRFDLDLLNGELQDLLSEHEVVAWDEREQAVSARHERRLGALVLASRPLATVDRERQRQALITGIRRLGLDCLPWTPALRQWQARVVTLHHWCPEQGWPEISDDRLLATLEDWLGPWLTGLSRRTHLAQLDLGAILKAQLGWPLNNQLDQAAPTHLTVPSGSRIQLAYGAVGEPPVLAVKLQELFGLAEAPRLNGGRIPLLLHLLSPARRPIQITRDLASFWHTTYAEVKKELKGRYPKHPWPDDPWTASPSRGTRAQRR